MKILITALLLSTLIGCSTLEKLGDYVSENDVSVSQLIRQAVGSYIAAPESIEDEFYRAAAIEYRLLDILDQIEGEPVTSNTEFIKAVGASVDWSELTEEDKLLAGELVLAIHKSLEGKQVDNISIKAAFETAISTARIYLMR